MTDENVTIQHQLDQAVQERDDLAQQLRSAIAERDEARENAKEWQGVAEDLAARRDRAQLDAEQWRKRAERLFDQSIERMSGPTAQTNVVRGILDRVAKAADETRSRYQLTGTYQADAIADAFEAFVGELKRVAQESP